MDRIGQGRDNTADSEHGEAANDNGYAADAIGQRPENLQAGLGQAIGADGKTDQ